MEIFDLHTHILFGIDHGVQERDEMLRNLDEYAKEGFTRVVFTPHIFHPTVYSAIDRIRENLAVATEDARERGLSVTLGSELYLDSQLEVRVLPVNGIYALVEFPPSIPPFALERKLPQIREQGYELIIAHVERYEWVKPENSYFKLFMENGARIQVNVSGIENRKALPYLERGLVDVIASDNHGDATLPGRLKRALDQNPLVLERMQEFEL